MVNEINTSSANLSSLGAALSSGVNEVSNDNKGAAKAAEAKQLFELIDGSSISDQAKRLNEAFQFGKLAQKIEMPRSERFEMLKAAVAQNGAGAVADQYNTEALAKKLINSPAGSFLR